MLSLMLGGVMTGQKVDTVTAWSLAVFSAAWAIGWSKAQFLINLYTLCSAISET